ncbi:peptidase M42 [Anoxybacter fermentans]|uniref:Peptidase M42 n=1 Tax=Anoxybacter fermentans TaxID=1323375 RepID=A0A3S9SWW6_9FIRM|nr:M42 family metallopeptidase [Anoxybacter fermentans]AZR72833.1 peptidase M42 [Anoxybacter fermentans]
MLLKRLTEAAGLPGMEDEVRNLIKEEVKDLVDDMRTDALGNLITYKKGKVDGPVVMLAAHMDEIGLMITHINKNGLLRFKPLGGIDPRVLVSKKVLIGPKKVPGVIGSKPIHLQNNDERKHAIPLDKLYIDIGAKNKEEAEKLVKIGDGAVFDTKFAEVGEGCVKGKAFDDRVGCSILIELLKRKYDVSIYAVFTVQEEVGLRGASVVAYDLDPDLALVFEGTTASDVPDMSEHQYSTSLGEGPAISLMDRSVIADRRIVQGLVETARENGLKYQFRRTNFGGTDAGRIHLTKEGIPSAVISVPCRYIHSPVSLMNLNDYNTLIELVDKYLHKIAKGGFYR